MAIQIIIASMAAIIMIAIGFGAATPLVTFMYYDLIPMDNRAPEAQLALDNIYQAFLASGLLLFGVVVIWALRSAAKHGQG